MLKEENMFWFKCVAFFFFLLDSKLVEPILFGDDLNTEKLRLRRAFFFFNS